MWENDCENLAVVIDNGSGTIRSGYSASQKALFSSPNVVGRPKSDPTGDIECYGKDAYEKRGELSLSSPFTKGIIQNWDDMTKIWEHTYSALEAEPTERAIFLTEPLTNPMENREQTAQIFFETFQVPAFYLQPSPQLCLVGIGRESGVVFDCGEGYTQVVPVYEEKGSKALIKTLNFAGGDLTRNLGQILGYSSNAGADYAREIKEKKCYVALDFAAEMQAFENDKSKETSYELPDGKTVALGKD